MDRVSKDNQTTDAVEKTPNAETRAAMEESRAMMSARKARLSGEKIPNARSRAAMEEARAMASARFKTAEEFLGDLEAHIAVGED